MGEDQKPPAGLPVPDIMADLAKRHGSQMAGFMTKFRESCIREGERNAFRHIAWRAGLDDVLDDSLDHSEQLDRLLEALADKAEAQAFLGTAKAVRPTPQVPKPPDEPRRQAVPVGPPPPKAPPGEPQTLAIPGVPAEQDGPGWSVARVHMTNTASRALITTSGWEPFHAAPSGSGGWWVWLRQAPR